MERPCGFASGIEGMNRDGQSARATPDNSVTGPSGVSFAGGIMVGATIAHDRNAGATAIEEVC